MRSKCGAVDEMVVAAVDLARAARPRRHRDRERRGRAPRRARSRGRACDLPAPEGEESTSIRPRRGNWVRRSRSFDVLHLLAKLVDHRLQSRCRPSVSRDVEGLGAERVRLAVEFLRQELEAPPDRSVVAEQLAGACDVAASAGRVPRGYRRASQRGPPPDGAGPDRARGASARSSDTCSPIRARSASSRLRGEDCRPPRRGARSRRSARKEPARAGRPPPAAHREAASSRRPSASRIATSRRAPRRPRRAPSRRR